jgi:hypothetical protein
MLFDAVMVLCDAGTVTMLFDDVMVLCDADTVTRCLMLSVMVLCDCVDDTLITCFDRCGVILTPCYVMLCKGRTVPTKRCRVSPLNSKLDCVGGDGSLQFAVCNAEVCNAVHDLYISRML